MKFLLPALLLLLAAPVQAQVYGGEDDPYSQNPFASNMTVDMPVSAPQPTPTPAPIAAQPAPSRPDSPKPAQTTAAAPAATPQKPAQP